MKTLDKLLVVTALSASFVAGMQVEKIKSLDEPKVLIEKNQSAERIVLYGGYGHVELRPGKRYLISFHELKED